MLHLNRYVRPISSIIAYIGLFRGQSTKAPPDTLEDNQVCCLRSCSRKPLFLTVRLQKGYCVYKAAWTISYLMSWRIRWIFLSSEDVLQPLVIHWVWALGSHDMRSRGWSLVITMQELREQLWLCTKIKCCSTGTATEVKTIRGLAKWALLLKFEALEILLYKTRNNWSTSIIISILPKVMQQNSCIIINEEHQY